MTFKEAYRKLEADFCQQAQEDRRDLCLECIFLPNIEPEGPVDYILVGMEPSLVGMGQEPDRRPEEDRQRLQKLLRSMDSPPSCQELPVPGRRILLRNGSGEGSHARRCARRGKRG